MPSLLSRLFCCCFFLLLKGINEGIIAYWIVHKILFSIPATAFQTHRLLRGSCSKRNGDVCLLFGWLLNWLVGWLVGFDYYVLVFLQVNIN